MRRNLALAVTLGLCALALAAPPVTSAEELPAAAVIPFSEARMIIEVNDTDQDAGIQIFFDGPGWKQVKVFDPRGKKIADFTAKGSLEEIGITELRFEGEEPSLADVPLDDFLAKFPAGQYLFRGTTVEGEKLFRKGRFTHTIPDAPELIAPADGAVVDPNHTVISWNPVPDPAGSEIVKYQVIVERDDEELIFDVTLPASVHSVTVPPEFLEPGTDYKYEVLAIEKGGNQTISEIEFSTSG